MDLRYPMIGLSIVCLAVFPIMIVAEGWQVASASITAGICFRVGLVLGAIGLAYPQIRGLSKNSPNWIIAVGLGLVLIAAAARGRLAIIAVGIFVAILIVHFGLRLLSRSSPPRKRN